MRTYLLLAALLGLVLFSTTELQAQTTVYVYPTTQRFVKGEPFNISRILTTWTYCGGNGDNSSTDKVYQSYFNSSYATTQPATTMPNSTGLFCHNFTLQTEGHYYEFVGHSSVHKGRYTINDDKNVEVTLNDGKKLLLITDQLSDGILIMREL